MRRAFQGVHSSYASTSKLHFSTSAPPAPPRVRFWCCVFLPNRQSAELFGRLATEHTPRRWGTLPTIILFAAAPRRLLCSSTGSNSRSLRQAGRSLAPLVDGRFAIRRTHSSISAVYGWSILGRCFHVSPDWVTGVTLERIRFRYTGGLGYMKTLRIVCGWTWTYRSDEVGQLSTQCRALGSSGSAGRLPLCPLLVSSLHERSLLHDFM